MSCAQNLCIRKNIEKTKKENEKKEKQASDARSRSKRPRAELTLRIVTCNFVIQNAEVYTVQYY
jgi:hypothetical protein